MNLVARIQAFKDSQTITAGPLGPHAVAVSMLPQCRSPLARRMLLDEARVLEHRLARGSTITAVALGLHEPLAFDAQVIRMPVFLRHAPRGLQEPRIQVIRALAMQQIVGMAATYAQMLGACILLAQANPRAAYRLLMPADSQGAKYSLFALEIFLSVAVCGGFVVAEAVAAAGRRTMDAGARCIEFTRTARSRYLTGRP